MAFANILMFVVGLFLMIGGPTLGLMAYYNGNAGPEVAAWTMIATGLGIGLTAGFLL